MKYCITLILLLNWMIVLVTPVLAQNSGLTPPKLQIDIPQFNVTSNNSGDWIGMYIKAIYKYATGVVGILAAVVMMFGGILWLTAGGDTGKISDAKDWIKSSLIGLILALSSYTILYAINPDLVAFKALTIPQIKLTDTSTISNLKTQKTTGWSETSNTKAKIDDLKTYYINALGVTDKAGGIEYIKNNEGKNLEPYKDANFYSVGYGHFLSQDEYQQIKDKGGKITVEQAEQFFARDYNQAVSDAKEVSEEYGINFDNLTVSRQNALIDMAYNMGGGSKDQGTGLAGFKNTLTAVKEEKWKQAAAGILNSKYATQVGKRAEKNAAIMLQGN